MPVQKRVGLPDVDRQKPIAMKTESDVRTLAQKVGYQITKYGVPEIWKHTQGDGIKVAVLDTGCAVGHVDLRQSFFKRWNPTGRSEAKRKKRQLLSFTSQARRLKLRISRARGRRRKKQFRSQLRSVRKSLKKLRKSIRGIMERVSDRDSHGTHTTGIVTANNNTVGILGVAPNAEIIVVKVLGDDGTGTYRDVADGIIWAVKAGADIISMSLGGSTPDKGVKQAVKMAYNKGVPVICAAGNSGKIGKLDFPAQYKETIAIGAVNKKSGRAGFSQTGKNLDFMAPGVDILSTVPKNRYAVYSGTSMATPWVSGIVAMMMAKHRKMGGKTPINGVEDVRQHLKRMCSDMGRAGRDPKTGFGLIDATEVIENGNGVT